LRAAIALAKTEHLAVIDVRGKTATADWRVALRHRLADPRVALVGARTLVPASQDKARFVVQGPIVIGAQSRMGTGHFLDDPGPGGWLVVDQEVSAVAPPGLLGCRRALAACAIPSLSGDALWIDICAQLRAAGGAVVWTPDVSFLMSAGSLRLDADCLFRNGSDIARSMPWEDPFHHPALSLRGDLLQVEQRLGLVRAAPADPRSLLLTGMAEHAMGAINGARALRAMGLVEASWSPENISAADVGRRAPTSWIRLNPETAALPHMAPYTAIISKAPKSEAKAVLAAATQVFATSPELVTQARRMLPPNRSVALWRPALSRPVWAELSIGNGINSRPRILWIDEGFEPSWLPDLINETFNEVSWIIVERPGGTYQGSVTRIRPAPTEQAWAAELAGVAPHILVRPADRHAEADHCKALMAAAVGCHLLVDDRLASMPTAVSYCTIVQLSGVKLLSTSQRPASVSSIICLPMRCSIEDSSCRLTKSELVAPNMASTTAPMRSPSTPMMMRPCSCARSAMPASMTSGSADTAESWLITPLTQLSSCTGQRMRCESEKAILRMMMSDRLSIRTERSCGVRAEASRSIALVSSDSSTKVMMSDTSLRKLWRDAALASARHGHANSNGARAARQP
jgi:hypothetical protein